MKFIFLNLFKKKKKTPELPRPDWDSTWASESPYQSRFVKFEDKTTEIPGATMRVGAHYPISITNNGPILIMMLLPNQTIKPLSCLHVFIFLSPILVLCVSQLSRIKGCRFGKKWKNDFILIFWINAIFNNSILF